MANKMLIDATHPEETRVVVLRGNRVEEFDFESAQRKQLRGNIYLAKVTRVEPSLQAAFVDYGGNRHGFLAFSEIHPDYYQIPVADRQALIDEEERAQRAADDEADRRSRRHRQHRRGRRDDVVRGEAAEAQPGETSADEAHLDEDHIEEAGAAADAHHDDHHASDAEAAPDSVEAAAARTHEHADEHAEADHTEPSAALDAEEPAADVVAMPGDAALGDMESVEENHEIEVIAQTAVAPEAEGAEVASPPTAENGEGTSVVEVHDHENGDEEEVVESVGGADALEEVPDRAPRYRRQYKIQEVIKRRQVMLVQVVKEERGTKGAALTTYLSLAGRYSVLMPNTARGGGISRKITSAEDRARLKEAAAELEVPEGMGVILRTAGASRTKIEIKRDFEYLLRMWETVRDLTLKSTAPKLVYEEGSLVKRSIRDLYSKDIDEVVVAGDEAYHEAKDFMRMLMPGHARSVKPYHETQPLLARFGVESQLDAMFSPTVQLRSGGYIVINQAEALVAIDVNSGRATREHHIEDTALKTNLEAADEVSRQLRLRDLAGLIVIDFIDMDEKRNNRSVERRLKECLKHDRARIQVGRISHFGLLEMSRQRIRTSVLESSTEKCPYCGGSGHVRSVSSLALQVLRALEEQMMRGATHDLIARTRPDVALYVLNQKRAHLRGLEERFAITITISSDPSLTAPQAFIIERGELVHSVEAAKALAEKNQAAVVPLEEEDDLEEFAVAEDEEAEETEAGAPAGGGENGEGVGSRRRRRRRRRGGRNGAHGEHHSEHNGEPHPDQHVAASEHGGEFDDDAVPGAAEGDGNGLEQDGDETASAEGYGEQPAGEFTPRDRNEGDEARHNGERRRRRGRRGGRRNRQRNGEPGGYERGPQEHQGHDEGSLPDYAAQSDEPAAEPANELIATPTTEPELKTAVADLDAAPPRAPDVSHAPTVAEAEPPRRRSTVRERAPIASSEAPTATAMPEPAVPSAPAPVIVDNSGDTAETDKPRRTGWWSRRFAGG